MKDNEVGERDDPKLNGLRNSYTEDHGITNEVTDDGQEATQERDYNNDEGIGHWRVKERKAEDKEPGEEGVDQRDHHLRAHHHVETVEEIAKSHLKFFRKR
jgi:hypothetical protein